ncbi:hypothetical protein [Rhizobium jaguaris]|uniref:Uncharacterized protein n=1 Tax=Rhizobium jaguaris TaxID=1312183 RepID=A0A387FRA0_9HYPH|nr:hypothetical protein [Rhizobium jaguaris]AYG59935.1 hypothetical protein CCGE525_14800 [Rhizobium jaguaris]
MAVVSITMDTRKSAEGILLPQDVELNILAVELFYYACSVFDRGGGPRGPVDDMGDLVQVDQISFTNPFEIWAVLRKIPISLARKVLDRVLFYQEEQDKRAIANAKAWQSVVSDKLDNIRKANKVRRELLASGLGEEEVAEVLGRILSDQLAVIEVHEANRPRVLAR